jgi:hypothetical protein
MTSNADNSMFSLPPRQRTILSILRTFLRAAGVAVFFIFAAAILLGTVMFGAGCAFTQKVVDRTLLKSPEMRFEDLDPDRDIQDITGLASGEGGGGGGGGC